MKKELEKKMQENTAEVSTEKTGAKGDDQTAEQKVKAAVSETWAEETIADLDEYIESQGIYLRQ